MVIKYRASLAIQSKVIIVEDKLLRHIFAIEIKFDWIHESRKKGGTYIFDVFTYRKYNIEFKRNLRGRTHECCPTLRLLIFRSTGIISHEYIHFPEIVIFVNFFKISMTQFQARCETRKSVWKRASANNTLRALQFARCNHESAKDIYTTEFRSSIKIFYLILLETIIQYITILYQLVNYYDIWYKYFVKVSMETYFLK